MLKSQKNSLIKNILTDLELANTVYLFLQKYPVRITKMLEIIENTKKYIMFKSISNKKILFTH